MDQAAFEAELRRDGYEPLAAFRGPTEDTGEHAHGFDARLLVLEGAITITRDGVPCTFGPGDTCEVPAGERHREWIGPSGVRYISGRRKASSAAAE